MTTKAEKRYLDRVAELPCVVCGAHGVHIHHAREGQGMGQRAQNWLAIALCPSCHAGPRGIHGDKSVLRQEKLDEINATNTNPITVDGKEMTLCDKEMLPLDDGVLRRKNGTRCVQ